MILLGPRTIRWLRRQKIGDLANFDQEKMNELMSKKIGTPTMGGILIIFAIAITTLLLADLGNFYVQMAVICLLWLGVVGAVDDWLKLTAGRPQANASGDACEPAGFDVAGENPVSDWAGNSAFIFHLSLQSGRAQSHAVFSIFQE